MFSLQIYNGNLNRIPVRKSAIGWRYSIRSFGKPCHHFVAKVSSSGTWEEGPKIPRCHQVSLLRFSKCGAKRKGNLKLRSITTFDEHLYPRLSFKGKKNLKNEGIPFRIDALTVCKIWRIHISSRQWSR